MRARGVVLVAAALLAGCVAVRPFPAPNVPDASRLVEVRRADAEGELRRVAHRPRNVLVLSGGGMNGALPNLFMMLMMFQMMPMMMPPTAWAAPPELPAGPDGLPPVDSWLADVGAPVDLGAGATEFAPSDEPRDAFGGFDDDF